MKVQPRFVGLLFAGLLAAGCGRSATTAKTYPKYDYGGYSYSGPATFLDNAAANTAVKDDQMPLKFADSDGKPVDLEQFKGKKNVVLVVMRGFPNAVCPFCSAQTASLISNYAEFQKRDAEVLLVFPGPSQKLPEFVQAARSQANDVKLPFPVLLDEDFKAVDRLGIRGDLAKPSTYILDKKGKVCFAYVGTSITDRPSHKAMLAQLDKLAKS